MTLIASTLSSVSLSSSQQPLICRVCRVVSIVWVTNGLQMTIGASDHDLYGHTRTYRATSVEEFVEMYAYRFKHKP